VVTMQPGRPLPTPEEAAVIVRRQFLTPPPGYTWQPTPLTDEADRPALLMQLVESVAPGDTPV
jgi:hypothetical protein